MSSVSWQNALTFCLILAILLAMFALATPVFAASDSAPLESASDSPPSDSLLLAATALPETLEFLPQLLDEPDAATLRGVGKAYSFASGSPTLYFASTWSNCYAFKSSVNFTKFICTEPFTLYIAYSNQPTRVDAISVTATYGDTSTYFYSYNANLAGMDVYSTDSVAIDHYLEYLASSNVPPQALSYSLPAGNIAYIKLPSSLSDPVIYSLATTFPVLDLSSYSLNNQVSTVVSSIPVGQSTAPSSPTVPWSPNGKVNLFGLSRHQGYASTIPTTYAGQYLLVCNPLYYPVTPTGGGSGVVPPENGAIDIAVSAADSISVFPLDSRLQFTGYGLSVDSTTTGDSFTGTVDPDSGTIVWVDPDGGDTAPVVGGNTQVDSINDSIYDYLRNIVQGITEFLRGPVDAVRTVVDALRSFMSSFVQLYQWLPSPVYNLITSALMIALTIGVIKIFV